MIRAALNISLGGHVTTYVNLQAGPAAQSCHLTTKHSAALANCTRTLTAALRHCVHALQVVAPQAEKCKHAIFWVKILYDIIQDPMCA